MFALAIEKQLEHEQSAWESNPRMERLALSQRRPQQNNAISCKLEIRVVARQKLCFKSAKRTDGNVAIEYLIFVDLCCRTRLARTRLATQNSISDIAEKKSVDPSAQTS